ncbi:DUF3592 domain-containing protein [Roseimicrobium sp. ORNL1]|uniref:DUF3592 domain-containing protein n=1 Tax=Roseimicrobium sp. ORNL1 TaxID=2711231 RepID=UPI0013E18D55|nr:DUF3592 domain-containing protein [Roseimicrobium sp. ORNL1]QIF01471.1 DUF3592 domain-containing protein [Roseimicrobium sp. ORNL1]
MMAKIFTLLFILAGLGLLVLGVVRYREGKASNSWTEVPAKVESADMGRTKNKTAGSRYHAHVTYTYEVQGVSYTSRRVGLAGQESGSENHAQSLLKQYPVGSTVKAYYDPTRPEKAVLIRGVGSSVWTVFVVGLVFLGMGGYLTLRGLTRLFAGAKASPARAS